MTPSRLPRVLSPVAYKYALLAILATAAAACSAATDTTPSAPSGEAPPSSEEAGAGEPSEGGGTGADAGTDAASLPSINGVRRVALSFDTTCAVRADGSLKCWGHNAWGQLGLGDTMMRGNAPGQMGAALPAVDVGPGRKVVDVGVGDFTTCALLDDGTVRCWGGNATYNPLGLPVDDPNHTSATIGDGPGEMGASLVPVDFGAGRTATALSVGKDYACAILDDGSVKCWGNNTVASLRWDDVDGRLRPLDLGGKRAKQISAGAGSACAVLEDGTVSCWGQNRVGMLGRESTAQDGHPGPVLLAATPQAKKVSVGEQHACALFVDGSVKCWGANGLLGTGSTTPASYGRTAGSMATLPFVDLGGRKATDIAAGLSSTCAVFDDGTFGCWGKSTLVQSDDYVGDEPGEMGAALPVYDLVPGKSLEGVSIDNGYGCAWYDDGTLKCWGANFSGRLGTGDNQSRYLPGALPTIDLGP